MNEGKWLRSANTADTIERWEYYDANGYNKVDIIMRPSWKFPPAPEDIGETVQGSWNYSTWAYGIIGSGGWCPMPRNIVTLEDAKIFALTMWRLT